MKKAIAVLLSAVMALSTAAALGACAGMSGKDGKDGINGTNGVNGADGVNGTDGKDGTNGIDGVDGKSAYELFCEAHPDYTGDEAQWLEDNASGKLADSKYYGIVSFGRDFNGTVTAGTATSDGSTLSLDNCVIKLNEAVVLPTAENAEWEISIGGVLANGGGSAELLASLDKSTVGRIYFGVYADKNLAYLGANIGGIYFNYCWNVSGDKIKSAHEYTLRYKDGVYGLSVDGGKFDRFSTLNNNQSNSVNITDAVVASRDFNDKVRAITGQDYFEFTSIGADTHKCSCKLNYIDAKTSSIYTYENTSKHPLYGKTVYHLGSSISYGYSNNGVSFAEQIASLTGSNYVKQTVSGTTLSTVYADSYVERWANFTFDDAPEFLVLQLSTNDFTRGGIDLGSVTTAQSGFDTKTATGAIEHIIAETKKKSPDTQVVIYTCAVKSGWGARQQYAGFINTNLRMLREKWGVTVVDLFNAQTVNTTAWMSDDIHPNGAQYANLFTVRMINAMTEACKK